MADTTVLEINQAFENRGEKKMAMEYFSPFPFSFPRALQTCKQETTGKHFLESPTTTITSSVINYFVFSHLSLASITHSDF